MTDRMPLCFYVGQRDELIKQMQEHLIKKRAFRKCFNIEIELNLKERKKYE